MIRYWFGPEELPLAPPHEEDVGVADQLRSAAARTVRTASLAAAFVAQMGWATDEPIGLVAPAVEEGDDVSTATVELRGAVVMLAWENTEAPPILDDVHLPVLARPTIRPPFLISRFGWDEEVTSFITVDESERPVLARPVLRPPVRLAWAEEGEAVVVVPPPLEDEGGVQRAPHAPRARALRLVHPDEGAWLGLDDEPWAVPAPAQARARTLPAQGQPDELGGTRVGDDAWLPQAARPVRAVQLRPWADDGRPAELGPELDLQPPFGAEWSATTRGAQWSTQSRSTEWS